VRANDHIPLPPPTPPPVPEPPYAQIVGNVLRDPYQNPQGCWARNRALADQCTHPEWRNLILIDRAKYVKDAYQKLLQLHNMPAYYNANVLTCKAVKESCLRPQDQNSLPGSTAVGISQVLEPTARDLFVRYPFESKVIGYTSVNNGTTFHSRMRNSVLAQLELAMMTLDSKRRDRNTTNMNSLLQGYRGHRSDRVNRAYASSILECSSCIGNGQITDNCLRKAGDNCYPKQNTRRRR
jgi:hypothetical protein